MRILAAHQPDFMPYLGFWSKVETADVFAVMPHAQFSRGGFQNRVKIGIDGNWKWLTVPVKSSFGDSIADTKIQRISNDGKDKLRKLAEVLSESTGSVRGPASDVICAILDCVDGESLADFNLKVLGYLADELKVGWDPVIAPKNTGQSASQYLAELCVSHGCDTYLSGMGAVSYLDIAAFINVGVSVVWNKTEVTAPYKTVSAVSALHLADCDWRELVDVKVGA